MDKLMTAASALSVTIPKYWSTTWYDVLLNAIVFNSLIATDYQGEIANLGDTVNVTQFPEFDDAYEFQEGEAVPADGITASQIQLVVNKRVAKDFIITNTAAVQGLDAQAKIRNLAFYAIMKKMQKVIISLIVPTVTTNALSYTSGTTLALADLLAAKKALDKKDVPDSNRYSIHGSDQWNDFFNITGFTSRDFNPDVNNVGVLTSGSIPGKVLGFTPNMTNAAVSTSYFFHRSFMQMAVQKTPVPKVFDRGGEGVRAERVNMDVLFGVKQFDANRVATLG